MVRESRRRSVGFLSPSAAVVSSSFLSFHALMRGGWAAGGVRETEGPKMLGKCALPGRSESSQSQREFIVTGRSTRGSLQSSI